MLQLVRGRGSFLTLGSLGIAPSTATEGKESREGGNIFFKEFNNGKEQISVLAHILSLLYNSIGYEILKNKNTK